MSEFKEKIEEAFFCCTPTIKLSRQQVTEILRITKNLFHCFNCNNKNLCMECVVMNQFRANDEIVAKINNLINEV